MASNLTQQCLECEKLVLVSKFDEHRQIPGLCVPSPIKCTICQNYIEKSLFREHFHECFRRRIDELNRIESLNGQTIRPNNGLIFVQSVMNAMELFEQQMQMSRLPTTLNDVDVVRRAREQNCGHFYHILVMLKFILLNWSKIPFFILTLATDAFLEIGLLTFRGYTILSHWAFAHTDRERLFIFSSGFILHFGTSFICQYVSDTTIIFCFSLFLFLWGCTNRLSLEIFEMNPLFDKTGFCIVYCCLGIFIMKIILLLIRFYHWFIPKYVVASLLLVINFYLSIKAHLGYANTIRT
jgi:hypothetical protein